MFYLKLSHVSMEILLAIIHSIGVRADRRGLRNQQCLLLQSSGPLVQGSLEQWLLGCVWKAVISFLIHLQKLL